MFHFVRTSFETKESIHWWTLGRDFQFLIAVHVTVLFIIMKDRMNEMKDEHILLKIPFDAFHKLRC